MAPTKATARVSGNARSRLATTPADRLRVTKQQLQGSNNAQEKLYTMFEDTMEDLGQTTKDKLEAAENELETTKSRLHKAERDADYYYRGWKNIGDTYQAADSTLKAHEHQIYQLEAE